MRTLAITQNVTVNGSVEMLGNWFAAQGDAGVDNSDMFDPLNADSRASDALVVGRRTSEDMRGYLPHQIDDVTGVTAHLNQVEKFVASSTMTDPGWQNSTVLFGKVVEQVRELKERDGKEIVLTGRIMLCHDLIRAGLVDQYRFFVHPVVQGRGRRLFPRTSSEVPSLRLLESKAFASGITYTRYAAE